MRCNPHDAIDVARSKMKAVGFSSLPPLAIPANYIISITNTPASISYIKTLHYLPSQKPAKSALSAFLVVISFLSNMVF